jgi:hypothetical protein
LERRDCLYNLQNLYKENRHNNTMTSDLPDAFSRKKANWTKNKTIPVLRELTVKSKDVYHLKNLYALMRFWCDDNGYVGSLGKEDSLEKFYLHKVSSAGNEIWWHWRAKKNVTKFFTYHINIDAHVLGSKKMEIMHEGKKFKTNKGEIDIRINAFLELPSEDWKKDKLLKNLLDWFLKRRIKENIDENEKQLEKEVYHFTNTLKRYFEMKTFTPPEELFHPKRGVW